MEKICTKCGIFKDISLFSKGNGRFKKQSHCKECKKKWTDENKEHLIEYKKKYHIDNKEKHNKKSFDTYWKNRVPFKFMTKEEASKRQKEMQHRWYETNKEMCLERAVVLTRNRRSKIKNNGGSFTLKEWKNLCNKWKDTCLSCGRIGKLSIDHVIPVSKGGNNSIWNIQPLCMPCNSKKGTKIIDFRFKIELVDN